MAVRSMELVLRTEGIGEAAGLLSRIGPAARESAGPMARIGRALKGLSDASPVEKIGQAAKTAQGHFESLASEITTAAKAYRDFGAAQREVSRNRLPRGTREPGGVISRIGTEAAGTSGTATRLEAARSALTAGQAAGAEGATLHDLRAKVAKLEAALERERKQTFVGPDSPVLSRIKAPRFVKGPYSTLRDLDAQENRLGDIQDPEERAATAKNIGRARRNAERSILLDERRAQNPGLMQGPGLLESFQSLNSAVRDLSSGNLVGGLQDLGRGLKGLQGLFSGSTLSGAGTGAGVTQKLGDFLLPARGAGGAARGAGAAARIGGGAAQVGGILARIGPAAGAAVGALGPLAIAVGGLVVAVGAAVVVTKVFADTLLSAAATIGKARDASIISGGTQRQVGELGAFGIGPERTAAVSAQIRERLSNDPIAMGMASSRLGIGPQTPRPFGDANEAGVAAQFFKELRKLKDQPGEQLRIARQFGVENELPNVNAPERLFRGRQFDGETGRQIFDRGTMDAAAEFNGALSRIGENFNVLIGALGKPFLQEFATQIGHVANHMGLLARVFGRYPRVTRAVVGSLFPVIGMLDATATVLNTAAWAGEQFGREIGKIPDAMGGVLERIGEGVSKLNPQLGELLKGAGEQMQKWNDGQQSGNGTGESIEAQLLRAQLEQQRETHAVLRAGMTGGGTRASSAVPDRHKGWHADQAAQGARARYGGVTL